MWLYEVIYGMKCTHKNVNHIIKSGLRSVWQVGWCVAQKPKHTPSNKKDLTDLAGLLVIKKLDAIKTLTPGWTFLSAPHPGKGIFTWSTYIVRYIFHSIKYITRLIILHAQNAVFYNTENFLWYSYKLFYCEKGLVSNASSVFIHLCVFNWPLF